MLHTLKRVTGPILWANSHLLFWLSLIPFTTAWMGENHFSSAPALLYGAVLFMSAVAYFVLQRLIIASQGPGSVLKSAIGGDWKGKLSPVLYLTAMGLSFWSAPAAMALYVLVALIWFVPDPRIEKVPDEKLD